MFLYYPILVLSAILFYVILSVTYRLHHRFLLMVVFWPFFLSAIFPGVVSYVSPSYSIFFLFLLTLFGGSLLFKRGLRETESSATKEMEGPKESSPTRRRDGLERDRRLLTTRDSEVKGEGKEAGSMELEEVVYEIIDRAFKAKEGGDYSRAIQLFNTVLKKSRDVSVKGLVLSEMITLFKGLGKYLEGARFIDDFLEEEEGFRPSLREHFQLISSYLRKIDELLVKAQCPDIPYDQVSPLIRARAEKLFR